jgi:hypothetical protein
MPPPIRLNWAKSHPVHHPLEACLWNLLWLSWYPEIWQFVFQNFQIFEDYIWMGLWSLINQLKWKSLHGLCSWKSSHVVVILVMWLPISSCIWSQNLSNPSFLNPKVFYMSWKYPSVVIEFVHSVIFHKKVVKGPWTYNNTLLLLLLREKNSSVLVSFPHILLMYLITVTASLQHVVKFLLEIGLLSVDAGKVITRFPQITGSRVDAKLKLMMITLLTSGWSILGY